MTARPNVYAPMIYSGRAKRLLGVSSVQNYALLVGKSRIDVARRLVAAGLDHGTPEAVSRRLRDWGGGEPTGNAADIAQALTDPDAIWVYPLDGRPGARYVRWTPEDPK